MSSVHDSGHWGQVLHEPRDLNIRGLEPLGTMKLAPMLEDFHFQILSLIFTQFDNWSITD